MTSISITDYTPQDLLDSARHLLSRPDGGGTGLWPRAAAHLSRQALELTLKDFWRARVPPLAEAPTRIQLTALPTFLRDHDVAARTAYTWACLSNACHRHAYELAPSSAELSEWIAQVDVLQDAIVKSLSGQ